MAYVLIELLETVTKSSSIFQILDQYCWSILSQAVDEENLHDIQKKLYIMEVGKELFHGIQKSSYIMEASKEFSHDIQRNLYTMEFSEVTFHDIRINFHIMEYLKKPFHDIRRNFNIMEAHIKSTSPQSRRSGRQSFQNQFIKHHVVRQPVS